MEPLKKMLRRITFKAKILFLIYAVSAVPTLILIGFLYQNMVLSFEDKSLRDISQVFRQQVAFLNDQIDRAVTIATEMSTNKILNDFFVLNVNDGAADIVEYNKMIEPVLSWLQITRPDEIGAIRFYTQNPSLFSNKFILPLEQYRTIDSSLSAAIEELPKSAISLQYYPEERSFYGSILSPGNSLSIFTCLSVPPVYRTYLEAELRMDGIYQSLSTLTNGFETTDYLLIREDGSRLFSSNPALFDSLAEKTPLYSGIESMENIPVIKDGTHYIINSAPISFIQCSLVSCTDFNEVRRPIQRTRLAFILISLTCIVLFCALANFLVDRLLQRLSVIDQNIRKIQEGDFDIHIEVTGNDTIDKVSNSLNVMALRIRGLIEDVYENQIQMKNLQIKMLSQQISPHFLYNTLECLKMRAELNDQREIVGGLTSLGKLLRYYANIGAEFTSVLKELSSINDYVALMNLIRKNRCDLKLEVDEALLSRAMPNFVLQPLVENSIKHGGMHRRYVEVSILIREENGELRFTIRDDGAGIGPETLADIRARLDEHNRPTGEWEKPSAKFEAGSESIGIYNTHDRIKLTCGYEYGLTISSEPAHGTTVRFSIPASLSLPDQTGQKSR